MAEEETKRYRFILAEISKRETKIYDLHYEANSLAKEVEMLKAWKEVLKKTACIHCNGAGLINEWRDFDDCKTVTCNACKGSGLALVNERG